MLPALDAGGTAVAAAEGAFIICNKAGGNVFGSSNPRSFRLINLQAILNSFMFILPSESVSAKPLKTQHTFMYTEHILQSLATVHLKSKA